MAAGAAEREFQNRKGLEEGRNDGEGQGAGQPAGGRGQALAPKVEAEGELPGGRGRRRAMLHSKGSDLGGRLHGKRLAAEPRKIPGFPEELGGPHPRAEGAKEENPPPCGEGLRAVVVDRDVDVGEGFCRRKVGGEQHGGGQS